MQRRIRNYWLDTLPSCSGEGCRQGRARCNTPDACGLAGEQVDEHEADRIETPGLLARLLRWLAAPSPFEGQRRSER